MIKKFISGIYILSLLTDDKVIIALTLVLVGLLVEGGGARLGGQHAHHLQNLVKQIRIGHDGFRGECHHKGQVFFENARVKVLKLFSFKSTYIM